MFISDESVTAVRKHYGSLLQELGLEDIATFDASEMSKRDRIAAWKKVAPLARSSINKIGPNTPEAQARSMKPPSTA